jgi:hypothetical protein
MKFLVVKFSPVQEKQGILYAYTENTKIHFTSETTVEKQIWTAGWNKLESPDCGDECNPAICSCTCA